MFSLQWLQLWESCTLGPKDHPLNVSKYAQQLTKVYFNKHLAYMYVHVCALLYLYLCVLTHRTEIW